MKQAMVEQAKTALADTFFMYQKAHTYHWNVEGIHFSQFHEFFGDLYEEIYGAVDPLAEHIRSLNEYAPRNIEEMYSDKTVDCTNSARNVRDMVADLLKTNDQVIASLNILFKELQSKGEQGFMNFVADRLDMHKKHGWMLRATLKDGEQNGENA
jgi:starvation-inducible DNA-binding protein